MSSSQQPPAVSECVEAALVKTVKGIGHQMIASVHHRYREMVNNIIFEYQAYNLSDQSGQVFSCQTSCQFKIVLDVILTGFVLI